MGRVRCAPSKRPRKASFSTCKTSRAAGSHPQKVAEMRYAPVRKVCDYKLWVRCEASRPDSLAILDGLPYSDFACEYHKRCVMVSRVRAKRLSLYGNLLTHARIQNSSKRGIGCVYLHTVE